MLKFGTQQPIVSYSSNAKVSNWPGMLLMCLNSTLWGFILKNSISLNIFRKLKMAY